MICLLFGPPGCGKGTQARLLSQWLGIPHMSTGALMRASGDEALKQHLAAGGFASDDMVNAIIGERLESEPPRLILDGYPRTLAQAVYLDGLLDKLGLGAPVAIHLSVNIEILIQRLADRRQCPGCQRVYNLRVDPPVDSAVCDDCQTVLEHRDDDAIGTVRRRLEIYDTLTAPVVNHYQSGLYFDFDGDRPPAEVFADLQRALKFQHVPRLGD